VVVWRLPGTLDRSSCQRLCVEKDCGIRTLRELFVSQSDHGIDARGAAHGDVASRDRDQCEQ